MSEHRSTSDAGDLYIWNTESIGIYMANEGNANTFSGAIEGYRISMIINGFCKEVLTNLPMEFAVEATKLIGLKLEGSVG